MTTGGPDRYHLTAGELFVYDKQVKESDGFDVPDFPRRLFCGYIRPLEPLTDYDKDYNICLNSAKQALVGFNNDNNTNFKFSKILKANIKYIAFYVTYYITFEVKAADADADASQNQILQARVLMDALKQEVEVEFCRLKPKPNSLS